jgi:hypothetical protein
VSFVQVRKMVVQVVPRETLTATDARHRYQLITAGITN